MKIERKNTFKETYVVYKSNALNRMRNVIVSRREIVFVQLYYRVRSNQQ